MRISYKKGNGGQEDYQKSFPPFTSGGIKNNKVSKKALT